jgi:16S rRNA (guanine966-N2)-methyltransferase
MRIIAGSAGGIVLESVPKGIRPTMDRAREAIFSSLGNMVPGARVLDLFAGTGAFGIEALSRGAASAVFIDHDERCSQCIYRNLAKSRLSGCVRTLDTFKFLHTVTPNSFDLIFADPPYSKTIKEKNMLASQLCTSKTLTHILSPKGIFVLETFLKFQLPQDCGWIPLREKRMGETLFFLLSR